MPKSENIAVHSKPDHGYHMKLNQLSRKPLTSIIACLSLVVVTFLAHAKDSDQLAQKWSDSVWQSAKSGDSESLNRFLAEPPGDPQANAHTARYKQLLEQHRTNSDRALTSKKEAREKAASELREHLDSEELSQALRDAVTVQTLSDDLESAFDNADVREAIELAEKRIPEVMEAHDWLLAQELLFFLRTLYDDTDRFDDYMKHDDELKDINRRVSLLAQYAPKHLFELRLLRAKRMGNEPKETEFKPNPSMDWENRVKGIRPEIVKSSLRTAVREHIEGAGWRPLLEGGLEQLRLLATTTPLKESFPNLGDANHVRKWTDHIEQELATLKATNDKDLDSWTQSGILDDLLKLNDESIKLPRSVVYREFGDGATYALDEYSEIIWPDKLSRFRQATEGAFVGVGILIRHNDAQEIIVVHPLEGTPAYFGGVKPNDIIAEVNGESTVGWSLNDAVDRITGEPNTDVTLGMHREGEEDIVNITLTRDRIKLRSVMGWWKKSLSDDGEPTWDWYVDPISRIAYVKITQFSDDTHSDLIRAWKDITTEGKPTGVIIDLRYNPGGLLSSAVNVSNLFLKEGVIVSGEDKNGKRAWPDQKADPSKAWNLDNVATVVLVNQGSASASEIVAGCLQAHGAAVVVGERSYGKGSVQTVHHTARNARLKLTTQYYRLPPTTEQRERGDKGRLVHKRIGATEWGVDPDIVVKMTPQQVTDSLELRQEADVIPRDEMGNHMNDSPDRPDIHRLLSEGMDPQLEMALLILQARALGSLSDATQHALR